MVRKVSLLAAVLALVAAACGGGDEAIDTTVTTTTAAPTTTTTTTTTAAPTTTTAAPTTTTTAAREIDTLGALLSDSNFEATSARYEGVFRFMTDGSDDLPETTEMTLEGAFNTETESSQLSFDFGAVFGALGDELPPGFEGFFSEPMEVITIGTTSYIKWGLFAFFMGPDVEWVEFADQDAGNLLSGFSFGVDGTESPIDQIELLTDAGATVEDLGTETIRGVTTTHFHVTADVEALSEQLPEDEATELIESFGSEGLDSVEFDIYIGETGLLHRYSFNLDATAMPDAAGIEGVEVVFDIFDYNTDIVIEAPENVTPGDELAGLLGGFLGGAP
jgi:hypothetical protein